MIGGVGGSSKFLPHVQGGDGGGGRSWSTWSWTSASSAVLWSSVASVSSVLWRLVHDEADRPWVTQLSITSRRPLSASAEATKLFLLCCWAFSQLAWLALLVLTTAKGDKDGVGGGIGVIGGIGGGGIIGGGGNGVDKGGPVGIDGILGGGSTCKFLIVTWKVFRGTF